MIKHLIKQCLPQPTWQSARHYVIRNTNKLILLRFRLLRDNREIVDVGLVDSLRAEFEEAFDGFIDSRDEMYQIEYDHITPFGTRSTMALYGEQRRKVQRAYYSYGKRCRDDLGKVLADQGRKLEDISSLLEFLSGYGRVTRFIVTKLPAARVTVSDIEPSAVAMNSRTFGTSPLVSSQHPDQFKCENLFEVVFAGMIFSHFSIDVWHLWLKRLYDLLEPSGLLVFSTMGPGLLPAEDPESYLLDPDGFWFCEDNETAGRLDAVRYGSTWVSEKWVRKQIEDHGIGELCGFYPDGLGAWQDVYVVKKSG